VAFVFKNRILETSTTTGTGNIIVSGAPIGHNPISTLGVGNTFRYTIEGRNLAGTELTGEWETGLGTVTAAGFSRDTVEESSNANSLVNFSSALLYVFNHFSPLDVLKIADADYGDITVSTSGTVMTIDADVVTFAKMQNISPQRLIGRTTAGSGDPTEISVAASLLLNAGQLSRAAISGDITIPAASNTAAITAGVIVDADINAAANIALSKLADVVASTYTPTLTNVANLDASTAYPCQYIRIGSVVTVSGKVDIDPTTTATLTQLGISLPVASNIGAQEDCAGVAFASGIAGQGAAIRGDAANNRAELAYIAIDVTNQPMYFQFSYEVI